VKHLSDLRGEVWRAAPAMARVRPNIAGVRSHRPAVDPAAFNGIVLPRPTRNCFARPPLASAAAWSNTHSQMTSLLFNAVSSTPLVWPSAAHSSPESDSSGAALARASEDFKILPRPTLPSFCPTSNVISPSATLPMKQQKFARAVMKFASAVRFWALPTASCASDCATSVRVTSPTSKWS
jgi:hypothetical protein